MTTPIRSSLDTDQVLLRVRPRIGPAIIGLGVLGLVFFLAGFTPDGGIASIALGALMVGIAVAETRKTVVVTTREVVLKRVVGRGLQLALGDIQSVTTGSTVRLVGSDGATHSLGRLSDPEAFRAVLRDALMSAGVGTRAV